MTFEEYLSEEYQYEYTWIEYETYTYYYTDDESIFEQNDTLDDNNALFDEIDNDLFSFILSDKHGNAIFEEE